MEIIAVLIAFIVPIGVAIWTVRSSAKDTAKHIAALEESTKKQVDTLKDLAKIQLELSFIQTIENLNEAREHYNQISQRTIDEGMRDNFSNQIGGGFEILRQREQRKRDLSDSQDFYASQMRELHDSLSKIEVLRNRLGGV